MRSTTAIEAVGLSKQYRLGDRLHLTTLRQALSDRARRAIGTGQENSNGRHRAEMLWALEDVSFAAEKGQIVGVIGRNGAGKSTLLKILSRITEPTRGRVEIRGRVSSLLEVGTGFHGELTGRENIFVNGAILGMRKEEVRGRFDEIVAFAEIDGFIDTPVKRYSTGMYLRLAFAVAAHLQPEILLVDEVLAVGDFAFQQKCLGKISEVSAGGRTVFFVSHNLGAIRSLCSRCLVLEAGRLMADATPGRAIEEYLAGGDEQPVEGAVTLKRRAGVAAQVTQMWFEDDRGDRISRTRLGCDAFLCLEYVIERDCSGIVVAVLLTTQGVPLLFSHDTDADSSLRAQRKAGQYQAKLRLPLSSLKEGMYTAAAEIGYGQDNVADPNARVAITIQNDSEDLTHKGYRADRPGYLMQSIRWATDRVDI
ncbi:MAG TPA: polysaccharide ABC transporter ATP-binding protein [Vicinamibacterales bacterium]|nr:polysaccharide ABC transporter ATP-binding protein [Vicinamibacterales bacterium]